jgi:hypothetical protein
MRLTSHVPHQSVTSRLSQLPGLDPAPDPRADRPNSQREQKGFTRDLHRILAAPTLKRRPGKRYRQSRNCTGHMSKFMAKNNHACPGHPEDGAAGERMKHKAPDSNRPANG